MLKKPEKWKTLAIVYWKDATLHGTHQVYGEDVKEYGLLKGIACGVVVHEDKEQITLALDYFPSSSQYKEESFRVMSSYPKSGIYRMIKHKIQLEGKDGEIKKA